MRTLAAVLIAFVVGACASASAPRTREPLVVASDLDNAPFASVDAGGRALGRDVEMMQRVCDELGRELTWKRMPFEELLGAIQRGEVDAVCATLGITPERAERVRFTRPYFVTTIALVARRKAFPDFTLASLSGKRVAASRGTTSERALALRAPEAIAVLERKEDSTVAQRLASGEIDAAAMDGPAARAAVAASQGALEVLPVPLEREDYAIVVQLSDETLARELDRALDQLDRTGELRALDAKYGLASQTVQRD